MRETLTVRIAIATAVGALTLAGCGSDDSTADDDTDSTAAAQPSGGPGGGFGGIDFQAIQECLDAAGLDDVLPTDLPTDRPSDLPTDRPTDMPSEFPTDGTPPEGFPSGGPGGDVPDGGLQALQDPEVQAALEACGIDLPKAPGGGQ